MRTATFATLSALMVLAVGVPSQAQAQRPDRPWFIHVAGGPYVRIWGYSTTTQPGFGFEVDLGRHLADKWLVLATFDMGWLNGDDGINWTNYRYFLEAAYDIGDPRASLRILVPLGVGGVTFRADSDAFETTSRFAVNAGLMFQFYVSRRVAISLNGMSTVVFSGVFDESSHLTWIFPATVGMLLRF